MGKPQDAKPLYLVIRELDDAGYNTKYHHIHARVRRLDEDNWTPACPRYGDPWADFLVTNQQDDDRLTECETSYSYAWKVGIQSSELMACEEMEAGVKLLKPILAKLTRMEASRGHYSDYADYLGRIGEAIGVVGFLIQNQRGTWNKETIGEGVNRVRHLLVSWHIERAKAKGLIAA